MSKYRKYSLMSDSTYRVKLYKSGKNWVAAGLVTAALLVVGFGTPISASAQGSDTDANTSITAGNQDESTQSVGTDQAATGQDDDTATPTTEQDTPTAKPQTTSNSQDSPTRSDQPTTSNDTSTADSTKNSNSTAEAAATDTAPVTEVDLPKPTTTIKSAVINYPSANGQTIKKTGTSIAAMVADPNTFSDSELTDLILNDIDADYKLDEEAHTQTLNLTIMRQHLNLWHIVVTPPAGSSQPVITADIWACGQSLIQAVNDNPDSSLVTAAMDRIKNLYEAYVAQQIPNLSSLKDDDLDMDKTTFTQNSLSRNPSFETVSAAEISQMLAGNSLEGQTRNPTLTKSVTDAFVSGLTPDQVWQENDVIGLSYVPDALSNATDYTAFLGKTEAINVAKFQLKADLDTSSMLPLAQKDNNSSASGPAGTPTPTDQTGALTPSTTYMAPQTPTTPETPEVKQPKAPVENKHSTSNKTPKDGQKSENENYYPSRNTQSFGGESFARTKEGSAQNSTSQKLPQTNENKAGVFSLLGMTLLSLLGLAGFKKRRREQ